MENLPPEGAVALTLIMPVLETALRKAEGRLHREKEKGISCGQCLQDTDKKKECEIDSKKESDIESDIERECEKDNGIGGGGDIADFEKFWKAYPKKVGKQSARAAFLKVSVPLQTLLDALRQQAQSPQWNRDGGRFIPNPATWLSQQRWEDQLQPSRKVPMGATGVLGKEELESIQRMLREC